jgi:hypothetical protein
MLAIDTWILFEKVGIMTQQRTEISVSGKWVTVPALNVQGKTIVVRGTLPRIAVIHDEEWLETELEDPQECVEQLKRQGRHGLAADIFTFAQKLPATAPRYNYPMEWDSIAAARTTSFETWWEGLPQETRKNVRRSRKRGVIVTVQAVDDGLIQGIADVNNESLWRQGKLNKHFGKSLDLVRKDHSSFLERSDFICAYLGSELIGYLKVVYRGEVAAILNLVSKRTHSDKRPSNALLAKAVELCEAKGVSHLVYGKFHYGNKPDNPLLDFKIRNGFGEILMPRFYVPLSSSGTLCVKLKLHRGLLGIVPAGLLNAGVTARAKWYKLKDSMGRCSSMVEQSNRNRRMECSNPPAGSNS